MIGVRTEENSMTRSGVIAVSKSDGGQRRRNQLIRTSVMHPGAAGVMKAEAPPLRGPSP